MPSRPARIFLLSPARVDGLRAQFLLNPRAQFPLARAFHAEGLTLGEAFAFMSGLYFRGKLAYARQFIQPAEGDVVRVITSNAGLLDPARRIGPKELVAFGTTQIDADDPAYHKPLRRAAKALRRQAGLDASVVLLGSIATPKYRDVLLEIFGRQLLFPREFVGRGDMSRGALLLRAARAGEELGYDLVEGAVLTRSRFQGSRSK